MSYCGYVTKLENVRPHPNADRLVLADVLGATVIVSAESQTGDIVIYFPCDGQLSEEYCRVNDLVRRKDENGEQAGGFLDPVKRNVCMIKLRGEYSNGLCMPLESLAYTGVDVSSFTVGDTVTVLNKHEICCKFIPKVNQPAVPVSHDRKGKIRTQDKLLTPYFPWHIDTPQLRFVPDMFQPGDVICLTEKVHGTSSRNANTPVISYRKSWLDRFLGRRGKMIQEYKYVVGSRRTTVSTTDGGFYGSNQFRIDWGEKFKGKLHEGEQVYGEIAGYINGTKTPIMTVVNNKKANDNEFIKRYGNTTTFSYGCEKGQSRYFIYRMTYTMPDGTVIEYPWDLVKRRAAQMGFEVVPELDRFIYTTQKDFMERINHWMDVPSTIDSTHVMEGVVIRALNDPGLRIAKAKAPSFLMIEGIYKAEAETPDIEELEEIVI